MNKAVPFIVAGAVIAGAAAFYFWYWTREPPLPAPAAVSSTLPAPAAPEPEAGQHFPAPQPPEPVAARELPALDASDRTVLDDLAGLASADTIARYVVPQQIIRNIVVTVDNLPRKSFAWRLSPLKPVGGAFQTTGTEGNLVIAAGNASRYVPYVTVAKSINAKKLVLAYGGLYPLFQKAYEDLGYPKGYFNDRLIAVIDHLLATPERAGPIALVTPRVQSEFADPELEALSSGQKILLRMGPENAAAIKDKLREIRNQLTGAK